MGSIQDLDISTSRYGFRFEVSDPGVDIAKKVQGGTRANQPLPLFFKDGVLLDDQEGSAHRDVLFIE
jgi:hypothetical protein